MEGKLMTQMDKLIEEHFLKKPGENLQALEDRYQEILTFHKDSLTAALLATSYYGIEELKMRLPRLNDMLRNPFSREEDLHAITGLIMVADGGPAEGAKAIQIYMQLQKNGLELKQKKSYHLLALLAICTDQACSLATRICGEKEGIYQDQALCYLREKQKELELSGDMDESSRAHALLLGMRDEVETIWKEE